MDFSELDDLLDENSYVPTFSRAPRSNTKTLLKNNSSKSFENMSLPQPLPQERPATNLLQIHKETRKEVMSFEDLIKKQNQEPEGRQDKRGEVKNERKEVTFQVKETHKENKKAKLNDSYWQDDDVDDAPTIGAGRMKPPLAKRNDDNKSVTSRRNDENKSVASLADFKRAKEEIEPFNNISAPNPAPTLTITPPAVNPLEQTREFKRQPYREEPKQVNFVADTSELKKMLEEQLQLQRQFNEKLLNQERQAHKKEVERLKAQHQEEMTRKLQLKTLEIQKLKEFYEMQLRLRNQRNDQLKEFSLVNRKFDEGLKALEKAEEQLRSKGAKYEEDRQLKANQNRMFQEFTQEKQKYIQQLMAKLQTREKQFREEKIRSLNDLDRQRKKVADQQAKIYKKQRQLQEKFTRKERTLLEEIQQKQRRHSQQQSQLRLKLMQLEQDRLKLQQQRQELQIRHKKWQQSRIKLMQQLQSQKLKLITKEMQLNSKSNEWQAKESEMGMKERQLSGKFKLIELERKKFEVERDMKRKTGFQSKLTFGRKEDIAPTVLEKSIKQLKDQYIRNLGHI